MYRQGERGTAMESSEPLDSDAFSSPFLDHTHDTFLFANNPFSPFPEAPFGESVETATPSISEPDCSISHSHSHSHSGGALTQSRNAPLQHEQHTPVQAQEAPRLTVALLHKPRGSKGRWVLVEPQSGLRVSPNHGKHLRVRVTCTTTAPLPDNALALALCEVENGEVVRVLNEASAVQFTLVERSHDGHAEHREYDAKLFVAGKSLQFAALLASNQEDGQVTATTSVFNTHNTGKVRKGARGDEEDGDDGEELGAREEKERPRKRPRTDESSPVSTSPSAISTSPSPSTVSAGTHSASASPAANWSPQLSNLNETSALGDAFSDANGSEGVNAMELDVDSYFAPPTSTREGVSESEGSGSSGRQVVAGDLDVLGVVRARQFTQYSDVRLKCDVEELVDALAIVNQLQGKRYAWRPGTPMHNQTGGKRVIGLIAQEIRRVLPEVVHEERETGLLTVNYSELVPVLINALNEQTALIKAAQNDATSALAQVHALASEVASSNAKHTDAAAQMQKLLVAVEDLRAKNEELIKRTPPEAVAPSPRPSTAKRVWTKIRWPLGAAAVLVVLALASVALYLALEPDETSTPSIRYSKNLLGNAGFEFLATMGNLAAQWIPGNLGYSVLIQSNSTTFNVVGSKDTGPDIRPVPPLLGAQCLRLGDGIRSIANSSTLRHYAAVQRVQLPNPGPPSAIISASCNAAEAGTDSNTRFYLAATPILADGSLAAWQARLFFTFGYTQWESTSKTIEFTAEEQQNVVGFEVKIELITSDSSLLYCDDIALVVEL